MAGKLVISRLILLILLVASVYGLGSLMGRQMGARSHAPFLKTPLPKSSDFASYKTELVVLSESEDSGSDEKSSLDQGTSNFDGEGFVNYLAPYALAVVGSIVVTGLFVKFVMLDY
eukprot:scaffold5237_cov179-Amphora_coffeaeformis.AAC.11